MTEVLCKLHKKPLEIKVQPSQSKKQTKINPHSDCICQLNLFKYILIDGIEYDVLL